MLNKSLSVFAVCFVAGCTPGELAITVSSERDELLNRNKALQGQLVQVEQELRSVNADIRLHAANAKAGLELIRKYEKSTAEHIRRAENYGKSLSAYKVDASKFRRRISNLQSELIQARQVEYDEFYRDTIKDLQKRVASLSELLDKYRALRTSAQMRHLQRTTKDQ
jgi:chromosome segregation ATPase